MDDDIKGYRTFIRNLTRRGKSSKEIYQIVVRKYEGTNFAPSRTSIYGWAKKFRAGRESVETAVRNAVTDAVCEKMKRILLKKPSTSKRELSSALNISGTSVLRVLHNRLKLKNVDGKWVEEPIKTECKKNTAKSKASKISTLIQKDKHIIKDEKNVVEPKKISDQEEKHLSIRRQVRNQCNKISLKSGNTESDEEDESNSKGYKIENYDNSSTSSCEEEIFGKQPPNKKHLKKRKAKMAFYKNLSRLSSPEAFESDDDKDCLWKPNQKIKRKTFAPNLIKHNSSAQEDKVIANEHQVTPIQVNNNLEELGTNIKNKICIEENTIQTYTDTHKSRKRRSLLPTLSSNKKVKLLKTLSDPLEIVNMKNIQNEEFTPINIKEEIDEINVICDATIETCLKKTKTKCAKVKNKSLIEDKQMNLAKPNNFDFTKSSKNIDELCTQKLIVPKYTKNMNHEPRPPPCIPIKVEFNMDTTSDPINSRVPASSQLYDEILVKEEKHNYLNVETEIESTIEKHNLDEKDNFPFVIISKMQPYQTIDITKNFNNVSKSKSTNNHCLTTKSGALHSNKISELNSESQNDSKYNCITSTSGGDKYISRHVKLKTRQTAVGQQRTTSTTNSLQKRYDETDFSAKELSGEQDINKPLPRNNEERFRDDEGFYYSVSKLSSNEFVMYSEK